MRATILAPGSRGDVQPYVALAQALGTLGHAATVVTTLDHASLLREHRVDVATIPVNVAEALREASATRAVEGGGLIASFRRFADLARRSARAMIAAALDAAEGTDVLVTNFTAVGVADALAHRLGVPLVQAYNVPVTPTAAFPGALFPGLRHTRTLRRLSHRLSRGAIRLTMRATQRACVELLGARRAGPRPGRHPGLVPGPVLYGFDEAFLPRPADWPGEDVEVTGFWFVEEPSGFAPPAALVDFLDAGPPPVCVGFGSMSTERPADVGARVRDAARAAGQRLVLLSGWAGLEPGPLADDTFVVRDVPHGWLHPRCRAVVHHGGAGTTAAALRAGVPAVVVPFHGDQPFWAARVHAAGVGPAPLPRRRLTAARLASAIREASENEALRARAAALGRQVRARRGADHAARAILRCADAGR